MKKTKITLLILLACSFNSYLDKEYTPIIERLGLFANFESLKLEVENPLKFKKTITLSEEAIFLYEPSADRTIERDLSVLIKNSEKSSILAMNGKTKVVPFMSILEHENEETEYFFGLNFSTSF